MRGVNVPAGLQYSVAQLSYFGSIYGGHIAELKTLPGLKRCLHPGEPRANFTS
jgi:hypothetical protein